MAKNLRGGFGGILDSINYSAYHHRKAIKHLRTNKKSLAEARHNQRVPSS